VGNVASGFQIQSIKKSTAVTAMAAHAQSVTATQVTIEEISPETASTDRPTPASRIVSTKGPTFGDLTVEGQKAYQIAWGFYQDDMKPSQT
jgi:hypothetical protein